MAAPAGEHPLIQTRDFQSAEELVIYLMHRFAYEDIARRVGRVSAVLDLGCNTGYGLPILRAAAGRVTGADVSPTAVAIAAQAVAGDGIAVLGITEDDPLPFPDHHFDIVTSCQVIEHVTDVPRYLAEIRRVLKPGGRAFLTTPNRLIRLDPGMKPWNPHHLREYAPEELAAALAPGFAAVEMLGLRARPEVEAVERGRAAAARERARRGTAAGMLRAGVKAVLPPGVRSALKAGYRALSPDRRQAPALPAFSTADFEYRADGLDEALDLLAIARAD